MSNILNVEQNSEQKTFSSLLTCNENERNSFQIEHENMYPHSFRLYSILSNRYIVTFINFGGNIVLLGST